MKKQTLLLFGILVATLSSCVYSLFPIYTEDTLIFREDLLGKWLINEDGTQYLLFETATDKDEPTVSEEKEHKYSIEIREGFVMSSDEPISMVINGDTTYDESVIKAEMLKSIEKIEGKEGKTIENEVASNLKSAKKEYEGTITVYEEKSYKLTSHENGKEEYYTAHLVEIGGDLFMDIYPIVEYSSNFSENFFPVHTFFKVAITESSFSITHFDLDKLNKLFESNLIRLRHENVDGTILITAQPKELQKFFDTYADDESVFDSTETYRKAS